MKTVEIKDYENKVIGQLTFPDNVTDEEIAIVLEMYRRPPPTEEEMQNSYLEKSIRERKEFADSMLEKFKKKNINEGITAAQGMWMHQLLRAYQCTFQGEQRTLDIMNLAVSGDLEIACLALIYGQTDDMSEPYHWMSEERKQWLINELKTFLGWQ